MKTFTGKIKGITFHLNDANTSIFNLKVGDTLNLIFEKDNPFDKNAIAIYDSSDHKLGFVAKEINIWIADLINNYSFICIVDDVYYSSSTPCIKYKISYEEKDERKKESAANECGNLNIDDIFSNIKTPVTRVHKKESKSNRCKMFIEELANINNIQQYVVFDPEYKHVENIQINDSTYSARSLYLSALEYLLTGDPFNSLQIYCQLIAADIKTYDIIHACFFEDIYKNLLILNEFTLAYKIATIIRTSLLTAGSFVKEYSSFITHCEDLETLAMSYFKFHKLKDINDFLSNNIDFVESLRYKSIDEINIEMDLLYKQIH